MRSRRRTTVRRRRGDAHGRDPRSARGGVVGDAGRELSRRPRAAPSPPSSTPAQPVPRHAARRADRARRCADPRAERGHRRAGRAGRERAAADRELRERHRAARAGARAGGGRAAPARCRPCGYSREARRDEPRREAVGAAGACARTRVGAGAGERRRHHRPRGVAAQATRRRGSSRCARARPRRRARRTMRWAAVLVLEADVLVDPDCASDAVEVAHAAELLAARAGDPPDLHAAALDSLADAYSALSKFDDADKAYAALRAVARAGRRSVRSRDVAAQLVEHARRALGLRARAAAVEPRGRAVPRRLGEHHPDFGACCSRMATC